jgi:hypothetical protein
VKTYYILSHSSDSECATDLQELLKMSITIFLGLAAEWALLHHVDESWFKFKAAISDVRLRTRPDVGTDGAEKSLMHLRAAINAGSCGGGDP